jgi:hypothetical protein
MAEKRERYKSPAGNCVYCGKSFAKGGMSRHLATCAARQAAIEAELKSDKGKTGKLMHLQVVGTYMRDYWMHIEIPAVATLAALDDFLRDTWVECCGHLSQFRIGARNHVSHTDTGRRSMKSSLETVFEPGMTVGYEYDFGSTTELTIEVISERDGTIHKAGDVSIMARNDPPAIPCGICGKNPAVVVCAECSYEPSGWMCAVCAGKHEHDDMFLPVVNSPRVGECGYDGGVELPEIEMEYDEDED